MLRVGITGGIGSGKSTVCRVFEILGIPVFYADDTARSIMDRDPVIIEGISKLFGIHLYKKGTLDRALLSAMVFEHPEKLAALNALVHPATVSEGKRWFDAQKSPFAIKEAAIFFESGTNAAMEVMVGVTAPLPVRLRRAIERTGLTESDILARMSRQMDEHEKMKRCDYVITNDGKEPVIPQVIHLNSQLLSRAEKQ